MEDFGQISGIDLALATALSIDQMLDEITLYWLTDSAGSSAVTPGCHSLGYGSLAAE